MSALDQAERDVSELTGMPWWLTRTGHPQVEFDVDTVEDGAERAQDRYDEKNQGKKRKPGVHRYAVVRPIDDFPLEGGLAREAMIGYASEQTEPVADELGDLIERRRPEGGYDAAAYG